MKRAGFTMIELIFVIVILGILSAVALPKFIGVSDQAKAGKCKAFVGTLNRTTLPAIWAEAMAVNTTSANMPAYFTAARLNAQIDFPTDCAMSSAQVSGAISGTSFTVTYGGTTYTIDRNVTASVNESPILSFN